ncbi:hypothetical protein G7Y89_g8424 [Cudoniella acicularis]|uniref:Hydrophobin n=1 Tax=Cudoniella acicularis TaxID=354080 RepID=A0A8H4RJ56_9HELO|nr:hypothetical protein G7Y89_g8424 [Cudoniella acicularis]
MQFSITTIITITLFTSLVASSPLLQECQAAAGSMPLCGVALAQPLCCDVDVLGVADLDCAALAKVLVKVLSAVFCLFSVRLWFAIAHRVNEF